MRPSVRLAKLATTLDRAYVRRVVTISITAVALAAIAATLADDREAERRSDGKGAISLHCRVMFSTSSNTCVDLARAFPT